MATIQEQNLKFLQEFPIEIKSIIGKYKKTIVGLDEIEKFIKNEISFWSGIQIPENIRNKNIIIITDYYISFLNNINNEINRIKNFPNDHEISETDFYNIKTHINSNIDLGYGHSPIPYTYSKTTLAKYLRKYYDDNIIEALAFHYYAIGQDVQEKTRRQDTPSYRSYFRGFMRACLLLEEKEIFPNRENLETDVFQELYNDISKIQSEVEQWKNKFIADEEERECNIKTSLTDFINAKREELNVYVEEKKKAFADLEDLYEKNLQLKAPVQHWKERSEIYKKQGFGWLTGFCITVLLTVGILLGILYHFPEILTKSLFNGEAGAIRGIIILATILSFLVYLTKTFAKMTFSSFHLQRDAEEREQLTMVYLALEESKNVSEKERELILQSLFSRSDYGLLTGDSSPTMPGLQGVLEKLKGT